MWKTRTEKKNMHASSKKLPAGRGTIGKPAADAHTNRELPHRTAWHLLDRNRQAEERHRMRFTALLALLMSIAPLVAGAAVLGDDYELENCVVRTFADDFTDELHSVMVICHESDAAFRVDFYFKSDNIELTVFDEEYEVEAGSVASIDVRVGKNVAMIFEGVWEVDLLEDAASIALSYEEALLILDQLIDGSDQLIYRIENGHTRRVPIPENMTSALEEFLNRVDHLYEPESANG